MKGRRDNDLDPVDAAERDHDLVIDGRRVGPSQPCFVIGEVAQAHEGSVGMAHAFIDAIALAGADAVKFQTHIAASESTPAEPFRIPFSLQDATRYDYWKRMEFTRDQWYGLQQHAQQRKLIFLSSPFSCDAVDLLLSCGIGAWKVGSGEISHFALLDAIGRTQLPTILSTGFASWDQIHRAVARVRSCHTPFAILQCTSKYPTAPEDVGIQLIERLRETFRCPAGLSDHSGTIYPGLAATAFGANLLEVHVTLSREMFGPDVDASITTKELADLVRGVRFIERMVSGVPDKDALATQLEPVRRAFSRSIVARRFLPVGTELQPNDLTFKKPGGGLSPERLPDVLGKCVARDVQADSQLQLSDLAPTGLSEHNTPASSH